MAGEVSEGRPKRRTSFAAKNQLSRGSKMAFCLKNFRQQAANPLRQPPSADFRQQPPTRRQPNKINAANSRQQGCQKPRTATAPSLFERGVAFGLGGIRKQIYSKLEDCLSADCPYAGTPPRASLRSCLWPISGPVSRLICAAPPRRHRPYRTR